MIPVPLEGYDVLVNVTNICDARCIMCNIWKNRDAGKSWLPPELLRSVRPVSTISFAGGEPFLHEKLVDMVRVVHENNPKAKIVFSSNGFRTDTIVERVREILKFHPNTQVTISLDGIGEVHDRVRGVPGAWKKVNQTFDGLGEIGLKQRNFGFTVTAENYASLPEVFAYARERGAGFSPAVAQSSKFLNVEVPRMDPEKIYPCFKPVIEHYLRSWRPIAWVRAFFLYGTVRYLFTGRRLIPCDAFDHQFLVDQEGQVLSCHPILLRAGSLSDRPLAEILADPQTDRLRTEVRSCHACWELCTARSGIRTHIVRVALWAAWNKLLAHLRLWSGRRATFLFPLSRGV